MASRATVTGSGFGGSFANYAPDLTKTNTLMVQPAPGSTQQRYVWLNGNAVTTKHVDYDFIGVFCIDPTRDSLVE